MNAVLRVRIANQRWIPLRGRGQSRFRSKLSRPCAELVQRCDLHAPVACGRCAIGSSHFDLDQLFRFSEGGGGHLWPDRRRCTKCGRRAGRKVCRLRWRSLRGSGRRGSSFDCCPHHSERGIGEELSA
jgi:hypothetical protein